MVNLMNAISAWSMMGGQGGPIPGPLGWIVFWFLMIGAAFPVLLLICAMWPHKSRKDDPDF